MSKKSIALILCAVLAIGSIAYGSVAYLTSRDSVANVFTVGKVEVKVDEAQVNEEGKPVDAEGNPTDDKEKQVRVEGNDYHLIPGTTYTKDPTMTVAAGSEECYARMKVTITNFNELLAIFSELKEKDPENFANGFLPQEHQTGWDSTIWICQPNPVVNTADNTITYEFRYHEKVAAPGNEAKVLEPLFTAITVPTAFTTEHLQTLNGFKVEVEGQAIQTANFDSEDAAWAAFGEQYGE